MTGSCAGSSQTKRQTGTGSDRDRRSAYPAPGCRRPLRSHRSGAAASPLRASAPQAHLGGWQEPRSSQRVSWCYPCLACGSRESQRCLAPACWASMNPPQCRRH
eukprot:scaffold8396_cov127-Isochrysis_galbana.AAC.7